MRDIEKMLAEISQSKFGSAEFEAEISAPKFGAAEFAAEYTNEQGKPRKEYRLPKDLTVTLITGYRADLRYKVVKRLEELEARRAAQAPSTTG